MRIFLLSILIPALAIAAQNTQRITAQSPLNLSNGVMSIGLATTASNGYLSATDWNTFNNKEPALTLGNLTSGTTGVSVTGGTGAVIGSGTAVNIQTASGSQPGLLSAADWTTFNNKQGAITTGNLTEATSSVLTISGGTGAVIGSGTSIQVKQAGASQAGYLSSADWNTFNSKQSALTLGNLSTSTTGVSIGGGTGAVVGSGTTVNVQTASGSQPGLLSSADWTTFNNKAPTANPSFTGAVTLSSASGANLLWSTNSSGDIGSSNSGTSIQGPGNVYVNSTINLGDQIAAGLAVQKGIFGVPVSNLYIAADTSSPTAVVGLNIEAANEQNGQFGGAYIALSASRGSFASPAYPQQFDNLGIIAASGYDGTSILHPGSTAFLDWYAAGNWSSGNLPTGIWFALTPMSSATPEIMFNMFPTSSTAFTAQWGTSSIPVTGLYFAPVDYNDGTNVYNMAPAWPGSAVTCTTSGTVNFNSLNSATAEVDLTASDACTLTLSGAVAGGAYVVKVKVASSATLSIPKCDWGSVGAPTLSAAGLYDDIHVLVQQSTSSNFHCYASQGFSE